ncbi:MAG: hypothetical protein H7066_14660 [Cytophagaceae bacterium]|nr:hypothetical protein [Gemmatimonadaceae bacterium]
MLTVLLPERDRIDKPTACRYSVGSVPWKRKRGYALAASGTTVAAVMFGPKSTIWLETAATYLNTRRASLDAAFVGCAEAINPCTSPAIIWLAGSPT